MDQKGILNKKYSVERKKKLELKFRLLSRANIVRLAAEKHLSKTSDLNVLDMGAAEGKTLVAMNNIFQESSFIGIELSEELIKESEGLPDNIKLVNGDVTKLPEEILEKRYDIVSAMAVLEHLQSPSRAVLEAYNALKHKGIFVATCPEPVWDMLSAKLGLIDEDQHEIKMTKKMMIQVLEKNGFEIVEYRRFMWAPISFLPYLQISVSPLLSGRIDQFIEKIKFLNWLFVNQVIVGRKV